MMLNSTSNVSASFAKSADPAGGVAEFGLRDLIEFLRRRWVAIGVSIATVFMLGCLYVASVPPKYAASASLIIDTQKIQIFGTGDVSAESSITTSSIETEVQILRSSQVAESVVKKLDLAENPEFMSPTPTPVGKAIRHFIGWVYGFLPKREVTPIGQPSPQELEALETLAAVNLLQGNLAIGRDGLSYAIDVTAVAADPTLAARIANAVTDIYLADQVDRQVSAARRLSQWLAARIEELRGRAYEDSNLSAQEKAASRVTYESFVQRYSQAVQQQSLPESQAHVITRAVPRPRPISPKTLRVLVVSIFLGGAFGFGMGVFRELLDRAVSTRGSLEALTQTQSLGLLPRFKVRRRGRRPRQPVHNLPGGETPRVFVAPPKFTLGQDAPYSLFAETLRRIKVASDFGMRGRVGVLGVVSSVPKEGKTTVAANLATLTGVTSPSVLLIDADFRNPSLSSNLTPDDCPGLIQVLASQIKFDDAVWAAQNSRLKFLPTGGDPIGSSSSELLSSNRMKELMNELRERFDLVIIDLPPMVSLVDVRAADHVFDGFVFVVEWRVTTKELVQQALRNSGIQQKLIGAVFNKVKLSKLRKYDPSSSASLRNKYFDRYREVA